MVQVRKIATFLLLLFSFIVGQAQDDSGTANDTLENMILYNKQLTYGVTLHNLGMGVNFRTGKRLSIFKTRMFEIEFVSMRSYKQVKMINPYFLDSRRFVYGKYNDAFFLRSGFIWKKLLNRKPYWGGVELRMIYGGGFSLGIGKPYYLYVLEDISGDGTRYIIQTERFDPERLSTTLIYGRAPFSEGLGEINLHPGIYIKGGLNFEFGTQSTRIKALEIGFYSDILPDGLTIMADNVDQIVFPGLYLNFSFGKRYNKY